MTITPPDLRRTPDNDCFLRALRREPTERTPIWLMRQAGRYLPEYNAVRARAGSFMGLCTNTDLATEVTLQPLRRYDLDAAILFSDILTIPDAMGLGLRFVEGEGPQFERPVQDEAAIQALVAPDMNRLRYVFDAVASIKRALDNRVPLIGFSGSPFTLACYMIEGAGGGEFMRMRQMLYARPDLVHRLLSITQGAVSDYLVAQREHGADALMIFDSWGGLLSADGYEEFSLAYMRSIIAAVRATPSGRDVPVIVFTKGGGQWLERITECGCDAVGLDWTSDLRDVRSRFGSRVACQGNLDPAVLLSSEAGVRKGVHAVMRAAGESPGHIFNLGHGIMPRTPPENVAALVDAVRQHSS